MKSPSLQQQCCPYCFTIFPSLLDLITHKLGHKQVITVKQHEIEDISHGGKDTTAPTNIIRDDTDVYQEIPGAQSSAKFDTSGAHSANDDIKEDEANLSLNKGNVSLNSSLSSSQDKSEINLDGNMIFTCSVCRTFKGTLDESR